ncbi:MAG TPA: Fis family transcriptional regulator, partial [Cupriavidus sp.]|nr:Fis family transcriptional regulator [Cupriavidus sp.]
MSANPIEAPLNAEATSPVLTVLIVEDDADVRLGCEQALRLEGIATRAVGSAEAALREVDT